MDVQKMSGKNDFNFGSFVTGYTKAERMNFPELSFASYRALVDPLGKEIQAEFGIIALVPVIQSAHESRAGNSKLAKEYGNLFGVKASETWKKNGKPVTNMPTWEVISTKNKDKFFAPFEAGKEILPGAPYWKAPEILEKWTDKSDNQTVYRLKIYCYQEFREYETWRDSLFDWGRLISTLGVYREAYKLLQRKETVRDGIRRMALTYATDPNYARALLVLYDKAEMTPPGGVA
jgi:flagellum-specific peptidoglycan hydrolase FlgJ